MNIVIMGGGKLGRQLALNMMERKNTVHLIEMNKSRCINLANDLDIEVIFGNGTEIDILRRAQTENADVFLAVCGSDQDNLVACQLAVRKFNVKKVIARANDPRNLTALRSLGISNVVSSTEIITRLIEQEVNVNNMHLITTLNKGSAGICTMTLRSNTVYEGEKLKNLSLPSGCLIISIVRNEKLIIPNGETVIHSGDEIVAVCDGGTQSKLNKFLCAQKSES